MKRQDVEAAYRATDYRVDESDGRFVIRIGAPCEPLDRLLAAHKTTTWAFITAYNPGSQKLTDTENAERQRRLEADIQAAGYYYFHGEGKGTTDEWAAEPSFLILGIDKAAAIEMARRYGQFALVAATIGEPARLIWVEE